MEPEKIGMEDSECGRLRSSRIKERSFPRFVMASDLGLGCILVSFQRQFSGIPVSRSLHRWDLRVKI